MILPEQSRHYHCPEEENTEMRAPEQPQDSHPKTLTKSFEKAIVLKLFGAPERLGAETQAEPHPETLTKSFEKHSF